MEIIIAPVVTWLVCSLIYSLFSLFAQRKERLLLIEKVELFKMGSHLNETLTDNSWLATGFGRNDKSFTSMRWGCLLVGLGLGIILGIIIPNIISFNETDHYYIRNLQQCILGASTILFGGLGLLVSFFIEQRLLAKEKNQVK